MCTNETDDNNSSDGIECPTCDREFDTDRGMKIHHAQAHGERLAQLTRKCDNCGDEYTGLESRIGKYCSIQCRHEGQTSDLVTKTCEWCECDFDIKEYRAEREPAKYCSRSCTDEAKTEITGEQHSRWEGGNPICECERCGDEFEGHMGNPNRFCSVKCEGKWRADTFIGENHPNWKGGVRISYGPNWHRQRKKRLEKDGYQCTICKITNEEHKEQNGRELDVHHIQKARDFMVDDNHIDHEKANRVDNLVTLCRSCHRKWESVPLRPQIAD